MKSINSTPLILLLSSCILSAPIQATAQDQDIAAEGPKAETSMPPWPPEGFSALWLNNIGFQKSTQTMQRGFYSGFRPLNTDHSGRMQNAFILNYKKGNWSAMVDYLDLRSLGGNSAYSLTNPFSNGVNTFEYDGQFKNVDALSGIYELALTYDDGSNFISIGKLDTSIYYLADPIFAGDLFHGVDYSNCATRVVAPPFPSLAAVLRKTFKSGWSVTGIVGDAFGDRETLSAGKNLKHGDMSYVFEVNYQSPKTHFQATFNHVDNFKHMDKDSPSMPGMGFGSAFNAGMVTVSHKLNPNWAFYTRWSWADGKDVTENFDILGGVRFDYKDFYVLASQSGARVKKDVFGTKVKGGDWTLITELSLNYKVTPFTTLGLTWDMYNTTGDQLLPKDGGVNGAKHNHVFGIRATTMLPIH